MDIKQFLYNDISVESEFGKCQMLTSFQSEFPLCPSSGFQSRKLPLVNIALIAFPIPKMVTGLLLFWGFGLGFCLHRSHGIDTPLSAQLMNLTYYNEKELNKANENYIGRGTKIAHNRIIQKWGGEKRKLSVKPQEPEQGFDF